MVQPLHQDSASVALAGPDEDESPTPSTLQSIERRVLWLSTRMIDVANRRPKQDVKVGGHQASSASMVSILTALFFGYLDPDDMVAIKPHAGPVFHAIQYLKGNLDRRDLLTLRSLGGLQAYPSRTKDPDVEHFSTGSVGLGAVAPLFASLTRRYICDHFGDLPARRFVATVGDAELDEGNVWEALIEPALAGLGDVMLIVDLNRQSLDRVVSGRRDRMLAGLFETAGWHVFELRFGRRLQAAFDSPGGSELRATLEQLPNEAYQSMLAGGPGGLHRALEQAGGRSVKEFLSQRDEEDTFSLISDLGGHDLAALQAAFRECDDVIDRPSVIFAHTIKGWGLPFAGNRLNHAATLSTSQIDRLREDTGLTEETEWSRFPPGTPEAALCGTGLERIRGGRKERRLQFPSQTEDPVVSGNMSTQEAFGRSLARLAVHDAGERLVTAAPDVAISTNLAGWINKAGVYAPEASEHPQDEPSSLLRWAPGPTGRHIELGIAEMNLFLLLGQLGLSSEHFGERLLPIGTVYDPFVLRGLDALIYALYNEARFIVAGTPSGVTLAPEGGAHQSTVTASIGAELPGLAYAEPAFATEVDWLLCDGLDGLSDPDGESLYMRLSTRRIDQALFGQALEREGADSLRQDAIAGGYRLVPAESGADPGVTLVTCGATVPEAVEAVAELRSEGVDASVIHLTSPGRVYRDWRGMMFAQVETAGPRPGESLIHRLVPRVERTRPIVSVQDAASHHLSWVGSALGTTQVCLGVDRFGESGTIPELYARVGISVGHIVNAALVALANRG